jgi:hypothetical protein
MTIYYASRAGIKGRRADGHMVYGIIPQGDGSAYQWSNCGAASEAMRDVSQMKGVRPGAGSPWPPTGASIRRETGDTSGGLTPTQTTAATRREYGIATGTPQIGPKQRALDLLARGYMVDLLVNYAAIDRYMSGSPGFKGNHRLPLGGRNTDTHKLLSLDPLYDGRRAGIPEGPRWIPQTTLFEGASKLELSPGVTLQSKYGYDDCFFVPSLTRLDPKLYAVRVPPGKFGVYTVNNGIITHREMYNTVGFTATCTPPQSYPVGPNANVPGGSFRLVKLTSGSRKGKYINAKFASEV